MRLASLVVALALAACVTREIGPREPIPIPARLSRSEALQAVERCATATRVVHNWRSAQWMKEEKADDHVTTGVYFEQSYLRIRIDLRKNDVATRIVDSKNFRHDGDRIHRVALALLERTEVCVETQLRAAAGAPAQ
jgi:hypothetical protein